MRRFEITGMSCSACSSRVEKSVKRVIGVDLCEVSLLTNSMTVEGSATSEDIISAVKGAGYGAREIVEGQPPANAENSSQTKNKELSRLVLRLSVSLSCLLILMYVSMGRNMLGFYLPSFLESSPTAIAVVQLVLSLIVLFFNSKYFTNGFKSLFKGSPNMDTLVAMGSSVSFVYSVVVLGLIIRSTALGDLNAAYENLHKLYFESAAMIPSLITVGKLLEARSKGKTADALKGLMKLAPSVATIIVDGKEIIVPIGEVKRGDVFVVKPGANFPFDGTVTSGQSSVDEASLTGESLPIDKTQGDKVFSGTVNLSGFLTCRADAVGSETALSKIIKTVTDASATKAPVAKVADKVAGIFVPTVMLIALVTFIVWLVAKQTIAFSIARSVSVLVISCPCALGLATPVAIMVGNGVGAKNGILIKNSVALERVGKIKTVVLDKTGTITEGKPKVSDVVCGDNISEEKLLKVAFALEKKSEHPLAKAVCEYAVERKILLEEAVEFKAIFGRGVQARLDGKLVLGGSLNYIVSECEISENLKEIATSFAESGKTPLAFCEDKKFLGIIAVSDVVKSDSASAIERMKGLGLDVVMLTGDNKKTAAAVQKLACVDKVVAEVLPNDKADEVKKLIAENVVLKSNAKHLVAMVGDGVNDAPALASADIGIAIGQGADVAVDSADVVLVKNSLEDVCNAIKISKETLKIIHQNLFWAFFYNVIGIPLAAGVFYPIFGLLLNPMFGAAAMSLSSLCVVLNALRLNKFKPFTNNNTENNIKIIKEVTIMKKTIKIEGMMCAHCVAHVTKCLEAFAEIEKVDVSLEKGEAVISLKESLADEKISQAIENEGYHVISIS